MTTESKNLRRGGAGLIIFGVTLLVTSCLPVGLSIKRAMDAEQAVVQPLPVAQWVETGLIDVDSQKLIQVAVSIQVDTSVIKDDEPAYHFPFTYELFDEQGRLIKRQELTLDNHSGTRTITHQSSSNGKNRFELETDFEKLTPPDSGKIRVRARLMPDEVYQASINEPSLIVYDKVSRHLATLLGGAGLWIAGALVLMIGTVLLLLGISENRQSDVVDTEDQRIRNLAIWCHLSSFALYLGIPFGNLVGVLVFWLINKDRAEFVDWHGREALNFQVSLVIYSAVALLLSLVLVGLLLFPLLALFHIVLTVIAAVRAGEGREYRYPFTLRLIQ